MIKKQISLTATLAIFLLLLIPGTHAAPQDKTPAADQENVEALIETSRGSIIIAFFTSDAPKHVEYFLKQAREGAFNGTTFHRAYKYGLIQGGDPTTKNASPKSRPQYGTGGLNAGLPDEVNKNKHVTGAVSAALAGDRANPSAIKPGSSGSQFFIVVAPQPQLDSAFTVFGRVVSGMDVVADISTAPADANNMVTPRIEITRVTIRARTPTVDEMKSAIVTLQTSEGNIKLQLLAESAPQTSRAFYHFAKSGLYDGTTFYRVSQKYYLEAGNRNEWPQDSPNRKRFFSLWTTPAETSDLKHVRGTVSMRQIDQGSTQWYFFVISQDNPALDGKHVPFAKVVEGLEVIDKIAATEVDGDKPKQRIEISKITIQ